MSAMTGRIFDIQRFGIHDGPGIRTTVFLKGCFLRCYWCHNPEGISYEPLLSFLPAKCIGCAECVEACPEAALRMEKKEETARAVLDRRQCTNCGDCAAVCDAGALQMVGRDVTVEEILSVVMRDRDYYEASGGGLTVSGGEPLFQPDFTEALLRAAKSEGLHCCLETSGCAGWSDLERMLPMVTCSSTTGRKRIRGCTKASSDSRTRRFAPTSALSMAPARASSCAAR